MTVETSKDWVTFEAHRVFDDEYVKHTVQIEAVIRKVMKEELHPKHTLHHITYEQSSENRRNAVKGGLSSIGGMVAQAVIIGLMLFLAKFLGGV